MQNGTIDIKLEKNPLTTDPNDYRAVVADVRVFTEEDLIDRMIESGAGPTRSDIVSVLIALKQTVTSILREGCLVKTDLFTTSFTVPGAFHSLSETEHHPVKLHLHPSKDLKEIVSALRTHQVSGTGNEPVITGVLDINSNLPDRISANGIFRVRGNKIKVTGTDPEVGIYFKALPNGAVTKHVGNLAENYPSGLMLQAPAVTAGDYHLVIKTQFTGSGNRELVEPRVIEYPNTITIV